LVVPKYQYEYITAMNVLQSETYPFLSYRCTGCLECLLWPRNWSYLPEQCGL